MEEACVALAAVVAMAAAVFFADLVGFCMGLGWGYYSKRRRAKRAERKLQAND
ncbi:hypothetical protein Q9Q95_02995 [Sphingomonas sp. DG1-23]|uniref:hypothetical protein n=1 Tax=Sphingomonas sp. DG1-23 TaxID=3068316 RepID=UPI00273EAC00|nr:hypothetical protein [Sphingomonas sp. DG1-23]MDP5277881.1 hypothetical protein [Sphingomonas sp. DG1-23]